MVHICLGSVVMRFEAWCFDLVIQDAALVRYPVGENF